jgi:hypothetical protein
MAWQHPLGFVQPDQVVDPTDHPCSHRKFGSMTESEVLHNRLFEFTTGSR